MMTPFEYDRMKATLQDALDNLEQAGPPPKTCLNCDAFKEGHCDQWSSAVPVAEQHNGCDQWTERVPF